jgi:hypothetical protein
MPYGTHSILDSLRTFDSANVLEYGEDRLWEDFRRSLDAHNAIVNDMVEPLVETTDDRVRRYGTEARLTMIEADEYTRADAQKIGPAGVDIGFPLRLFQISLQWTRKYLQVATPAELANRMIAVQRADVAQVRATIQRALFTPTNNLTYKDRLVDGVTLPLRALLNADSAAIPENDYGVTFDGATHTHYLATATGTIAASDVESAVNTVVEHGVSGPINIYLNRAQEAAVSNMANFDPYGAPLIRPGGGSTADVTGQNIQPFDIYNRAIGVWNGAIEVWVKPWIPANYILVVDIDPSRRVLARRHREGNAALDSLQIVANDEKYPLRAQTMEREFGVSVWGREQASILFITAGGVYVNPTFTA